MLASLLLATVLPLNASAFPQQDRAEEFSVAFEKALKFNERADLDKAIRKYKNEGISLFLAKVDARAAAPSPELNRWVDGYIASWERVFRTEFASRYDRYLQLMDSTRRSARGQLLREVLPGINAAHIEALNSKNETDWVLIRRDARQLADNFAGVSDLYYQSFALNILGNAWHPEYTTGDGDGMKALAAYEECLAVRKKLGLTQDIFHENILLISRELRALLGLPEPGARPEGEKKVSRFTIPVEGEGAWTSIPLESTLEAKPGSVAHFNDLADDGKITWKITGIGSVGAS
ncbi:MAG: hypothetical protein MK213_07320, partial [Planctomycetes bacterium]|nr:hypothetical protein [Planctomycetota bacterium]